MEDKMVVSSELKKEEIELIKAEICKGATDAELKLFLHRCKKANLDPLSKQIYSLPPYGKSSGRTTLIGIDGQRSVGHRSGLVAGVESATFKADKSEVSASNPLGLISAKVIIKKVIPKTGGIGEFEGEVYWDDLAPVYNGKLSRMWAKMPRNQLAKCAESAAWRKAFPEELGGLYTQEEMDQAQAAPTAIEVPKATPAPKAISPIIDKIKQLSAKLCDGLDSEGKIEFMRDHWEASSLSELAAKSEETLKTIVAKLDRMMLQRNTDGHAQWWEPAKGDTKAMQ